MKKLLIFALIAGAVAYLRDARRRSIALGRSKGLLARGQRAVGDQGAIDDVTLAHKVESELYRRGAVPKGEIVVNAEDGVVFLRGVLEQEDIEGVEAAVRRIAGVQEVESLLHLPGTPAPASRPKLQRQRSGR